MANTQEIDIIELEKKLCDFFCVEYSRIFQKNVNRKESNARHYIWFILHCHYAFSNSFLAKRYSKSKRKIIYYISEVKFRVLNQRCDKDIYEALKKSFNL